MKTFCKRLIHIFWYLFAAMMIIVAALVSVAHLMTPLLNKHRAELESWASELLQVPITIEEVHADWRGNIPELTLVHVVMLDKKTHKPVFDVQEIKFGLRLFSSLWKRSVVLQDVIISGAEVTVMQNAAGDFIIKDLPVHQDDNAEPYKLTNVLGWIFSQPYLALYDIDMHFVPNKGRKRELTIKKASLSNQNETHKANGNFLLHQELPTEVKTHIEWKGSLSDLPHIKARAHLGLEGISIAQWLQGKSLFPGWQINQGFGGIDMWLDWDDSQLQEVQTVFQWYDLEFYSNFDKKTYPIESFSGHVGWKREGEEQIFAGDNLLINFPNHLWPATTFYIALAPVSSAENPPPPVTDIANLKLNQDMSFAEEDLKNLIKSDKAWRLHDLRIGYLDIQDILPIILANSTVPQDLRKNIVAINPFGELQNLNFSWQGDLMDIAQLTASGEFKGLVVNPWRQFAGFTNLVGSLEWNRNLGELHIDSKASSFSLPSLFANSLFFEKINAVINFARGDDGTWSFNAKKAKVANADWNIKTTVQLNLPPQASPSIDLNADFSLAHIEQIGHYLPAKIMDPALIVWLKAAFLRGRISSGTAIIQGRLNEFPFDPVDNARLKKSVHGKFVVSGDLKNVDFHYAPQWPLLQQIKGKLIFSGRSMKVVVDSASLLDVPVKEISGFIPYLGEAKPQVVKIQANVKTDLMDGLEFIHQSPLEEAIGKDLADLELKGPMDLALTLSVPLANPEKAQVLGKADLKQAILSLPEWEIAIEGLNGSFEFTEQTLNSERLLGNLWNEPVSLQLATLPAKKGQPGLVQAEIIGKMDINRLQDTLKLPLNQFLSGATGYKAQLKLYPGDSANNEVTFSSDLQGVAVNLPAPYGKPATVKRDFLLNFIIQHVPGFRTQLKYANLLQAQLNITVEENARVIAIDSSQVKGKVTVAYPFDIKKPINAEFDSLIINSGNEQTISSLDPKTVPPLSVSSRQFIYAGKNLGQLNLNTVPKANGMVIQNFNLGAADYTFQSKGQWVVGNRTQQSQLQGTIVSNRVSRFLERLGFSLRGLIVDKGRAAFNLQWQGAPYSFSLATTSGNFSFALERGRIINLNESDNNKMDLGRMLSLFSLQTIPRRLSLDFSDLFEKGYSFDFMRGDFSLRQGSAYTQKPAVFEGPVAHVAASGRIGLLAQDYDLNLSISPHVTESLPVVAGALTLNPFVGAAAWLVNKMVLSKEVSKVVTYNYKVTGSWTSPVWQSASGK